MLVCKWASLLGKGFITFFGFLKECMSPNTLTLQIWKLVKSLTHPRTLKSHHAAAAAKSIQLCPTLCDPIRQQPTRLPHPWDSPGKNTGVGCHFLLQCMKVKNEHEVAQSCLTLRDPTDCSLPGSSIYGIFQARVLEWGATAFSKSHTMRPR